MVRGRPLPRGYARLLRLYSHSQSVSLYSGSLLSRRLHFESLPPKPEQQRSRVRGVWSKPAVFLEEEEANSSRRELSKAVLMGRKKQKVRWTSVEDAGFFEADPNQQNYQHLDTTTNTSSDPTMQKPNQDFNNVRFYKKSFSHPNQNGGGHNERGLKRSSSGSSGFYALPPRFERSAKLHNEQYELDSNCETEELPNGFTKIRSKNLDVLFRKDYYAQRMLSTASSSAVSSEQGEPTPDEDPEVIAITTEPPVVEEDEDEVEKETSEQEVISMNFLNASRS